MKKIISLAPSSEKLVQSAVLYGFTGVKIGFCTAPNSKNQATIVVFPDRCRETVVDNVRRQFANNVDSKKKHTIDTNKTRLIAYSKTNATNAERSIKAFRTRRDRELLVGLKLVNHYEKRHKWARTKMQKLQNVKKAVSSNGTDVTNTIHMHMIIGSSKWMKSPHLLSLYLLLLRLGISGFKANFETHAELLEELDIFSQDIKNRSRRGDVRHVAATYKQWDLLLENYNKLFGKRTVKNLYDSNCLVNSGAAFGEGIRRLCDGYSQDLDISHRFAKICNSNNIKMTPHVKPRNTQPPQRTYSAYRV